MMDLLLGPSCVALACDGIVSLFRLPQCKYLKLLFAIVQDTSSETQHVGLSESLNQLGDDSLYLPIPERMVREV